MQDTKERSVCHSKRAASLIRAHWLVLVPVLLAVAGCGGGSSSGGSSGGGSLTVSPGTVTIDTNCTGCNNASSGYEQFTVSGNGSSSVNWTVSGGDAKKGAGSITSSGQYTPSMGYLTADSVKVTVTAALASNPSVTASATITVTPGFLQPLSPENVALGSTGTVSVTGYIAEAGGSTGINYSLSSSANGSSGGQGTLVSAPCSRSSSQYTSCTVTYTAPAVISSTAATYIVGTVGTSSSKTSSEVLLNTAGVNSDPLTHENSQAGAISLGSSGGNNKDYDINSSGNVSDCCGGTLGALIQNGSGTKYILSNNHVLARSDQATKGEDITQPGLVDENCDPSKGTLVGTLSGWLPLSSSSTNADAAIAQIASGAVNTNGDILELGAKQADGTLAAAPPGVSSTSGAGEAPKVNMTVAKSGRTTGLTCANISAVNLSVQVSYYKDCAETQAYLTKTYSNQIEISGDQFSDAGDSGSLVVDTSNAEPVGLFFAGGVDNSGVSQAVATPVSTVLSELSSQVGNGPYTFVGKTDHAVSCLNYGSASVSAAQARTLTGPQIERAQSALGSARPLVNPSKGILGVATGKSSDEPGTPAILVYVNRDSTAPVPATIDGVRTVVVPTTSSAVATGSAPDTAFANGAPALQTAVLNQAIGVKEQVASGLMQQNPAFFGVGVGQSYDDPSQAALVIFVDRTEVPATLPATIGGLRTRYIIMSRLHVTRAYLSPTPTHSRCMSHAVQAAKFDPLKANEPLSLHLH
jgi:hypothetical protein